MRGALRVTLVAAVVCGWAAMPAPADIFSVDRFSVSADPADLLVPGPFVHVWRVNLGLNPAPFVDDVDALSQGLDAVTFEHCGDIIHFSVDRWSSLGPMAPSDTYVTVNQGVMWVPVGFHALDVPAVQFGLLPREDNLDAYSMEEFDYDQDRSQDVPVFFSLDAASPSLGGLSPADILVSQVPGIFSVFQPFQNMGLLADDDLDALALNTGVAGLPRAYFSLAPGSPSLALSGASAADVFYTAFGGGSVVAYPAGWLGLLPDDNVDALETNAWVPEPSALLLLMAAVPFVRRRG